MKVELLVTLKGNTQTFLAGEIFEGKLPEEIQSELALNRGTVRVIEETPPPSSSPPKEPDGGKGLDLDKELEKLEEEPPKPPVKPKAKPKVKKRPAPKPKKPTLAKRAKK